MQQVSATAPPDRLPPGTYGLPFIGETLEFIFNNKRFYDRRVARYGPIFRSHVLGTPTIFMAGPDAARFVLSTHMDHFAWGKGWPEEFKELMGESLFVQDGAEHKRNRALIMPAFHGQALLGYMATMERIIQSYLAHWLELGEFAWFEEFRCLTFDVASELLLGVPPGPATARLSRLFGELSAGLFTFIRLRQPWTTFGKALAARDALHAHLARVIQERRANPSHDALSLLLQARDEDGDGLSERELIAQALLLLFAGHETTTALITALCLELSRHPDIRARARAEQQRIAAPGPITLEQLGQMSYLDQVLREVERLHPPAGGGFRGVVQAFDFNGYHVPAGWRVSYSIGYNHRNPEVYSAPQQFDPDRFGPEREEHKRRTFSLIGFGGGPRICVGMAFAQLEIKIITAHLLRNYEWFLLPAQRLDLIALPTPRPRDGLRVAFFRRHDRDV